jgi:hypothetical protein
MEPFVLRAVRPVPRLGIRPGDRVIFDPEAPTLLTRWRPSPIPNLGAALLVWEDGALEPAGMITPPSASEVRQVVGLSFVRPGSPPGSNRLAPYLRVVR